LAARTTGYPLHGEGGLVSSVEDLALWHRHESLTACMDFTNGQPNTYARGVGLRRYRVVSIVGHGRPSFRIPCTFRLPRLRTLRRRCQYADEDSRRLRGGVHNLTTLRIAESRSAICL